MQTKAHQIWAAAMSRLCGAMLNDSSFVRVCSGAFHREPAGWNNYPGNKS